MDFRVGFQKNWIKDKDVGGGISKTEMTGYIPLDKFIGQIIEAGHRLIEKRTAENYYHFPQGEEVDLSFNDPTQSKGYDPADAFQDNLAAQSRINRLKDEYISIIEKAKKDYDKSIEDTTKDV